MAAIQAKKFRIVVTFSSNSLDEREKNWPLHYKSVIVVPICPSIEDQRSTNSLLGFLTIDSDKKNIFVEEIDAEILSGCADGIYNALKSALSLAKLSAQKKTIAHDEPERQFRPHQG